MNELLNNPLMVKSLQSLAAVLIILVMAKIANVIAKKNGGPISEAPFVIKYIALFFILFALIFIWLEGLGSILTALTIVAAALTIVSKELLLNFLGSFVIFWRELFAIGERVQVGDYFGDVMDKGILYFTLLEVGNAKTTSHSTGRLIKIPNSLVITMPVINATRGAGYVWNEIKLSITRDSEWEKGRELLLEAVNHYYDKESIDLEHIKKVFEHKKIFFTKLTPRVYISVSTGGFCLTLRYLCKSRLVSESQDAIFTHFFNKMQALGIDLAEKQP